MIYLFLCSYLWNIYINFIRIIYLFLCSYLWNIYISQDTEGSGAHKGPTIQKQ